MGPAFNSSIRTSRLLLRQFDRADVAPLYKLLTRGNVLRFFPDPSPPTIARVQNIIERQGAHWRAYQYGWWAVEELSSRGLLGWCGLQYLPETDEIEVGYLLGRDHWGFSYATEAARASIQYGFDKLELDQIIAVVHPRNTASIHVLEKLGMQYTGDFTYFGMSVRRYSLTSGGGTASEK